MGETILYNSTYCRLCCENNSNGELLYGAEESDLDLSALINRYLPLHVKDDGKFPRTICPGCNIQLQATVQFFELLVEGQKKLRELWKEQVENEKKKKAENSLIESSEIEIHATRIEGDDGNIYMMISVPSEKGELMYTDDNQLALRMEGLEKPRRKRGRPPKPKVEPEEVLEVPLAPVEVQETEEDSLVNEEGGRGRRRRKVPSRYREEAVAGPELERIFREHGVIDPEEEDTPDYKEHDEVIQSSDHMQQKEGLKEIIGRMETLEGQDLGQLVVISKHRGRNMLSSNSKFSSRGRKKNINLSTCEICGKSFANRSKLHLHRLDHKWNYECATCREKFSDKQSLDSHQENLKHEGMLVHEDKSEEKYENDAYDSKEVEMEEGCLEEGQEMTMEVSTCPECQKCFITKEHLDNHVKAVHQGLKPYSCTMCEKHFAYPNSLQLHNETAHALKAKDVSSKIKNEKSTAVSSTVKTGGSCECDICGKILSHPSSVMYHKETEHNDGRRYVCNTCNKSFKHKQLLHRHQLVHSDQRPFVCSTCHTAFKTKANLVNHFATHTGEKKYFCDLCGQQFAHRTSLTLHYRWHTGEKPFHCKVCGKNFSQNGNLMEHMRIHTGEKPFFCNFCARRFTTSSQFKLHIKRHTGERPWKCEICFKSFLHKDTWKCHVRRHRGERPYTCDFCQRGFTEQWALKKHLRIHTGEKPYTCDICGKAFSDCSNLTKHKKVHRGSSQEVKDEGGEGVVWQLVQTDGEGEDGDEQTQHIIYVTYQNDGEDVDGDSQNQENSQNVEILQQITQGNSGLVLGSTVDPQVLLGNLPVVVPPNAQLQLTESGTSSGTLQVASTDGSMSMPVTLTVEDGHLVAHIPSDSQFLSKKLGNEMQEKSNSENEEQRDNLQLQIVTEDGRSVQLISTTGNEAGAFGINFGDSS